jgi:hypothetical protein
MKRFGRISLPRLSKETGILPLCHRNEDLLLERVIIPEIVCHLISEDRGCSAEEAIHQSWLSEPYGQIEFPYDDTCPVLEKVSCQWVQERVADWSRAEPL